MKTQSIRGMATLALALALPGLSVAAEPAEKTRQQVEAPPLISHDDLQRRLSDPNLRLIDARPRAEYDKGHIPGAAWVDLKALSQLARGETIADQSAWSNGLASLGIGADSEVYIYDANRQHDSGRVWWSLSYAGVPKVGLVDGGFALWTQKDRPVSSEVPSVAARHYDVHFHARRVAPRAEVQSAIKGSDVQIVDARSAEEYRGEKKPQNGGRAGHIPSARSLDAYSLVDADGRFLDASALRERITRAGIALDRPIVVYSQGGNRSSIVIFALRRLGTPARHYLPGLSDWVSDPSLPIVEGNEAGSRAE
jgi:thiosulfate/3-mercaptopyruvate sulfurtransferase